MRTRFKPGYQASITGQSQRCDVNERTDGSSGRGDIVDPTTTSRASDRHSHNPRGDDDTIHGRQQHYVIYERQRYALHPSVGEALKYIVRDKVAEHAHSTHHQAFPTKVGRGQITRAVFEDTINVACKLYDIPETDTEDVVCMVYDSLGKKGDGRHLQTLLSKVNRDLYPMNTAVAVSDLMSEARKGTLAHIESQQFLLNRVISNTKYFFQSHRQHDPSTVAKMLMVCGGDADDSKSINAMKLKEELIDAGMCGEVYTFTSKRVAIDETLHKAYVTWLVHTVIPTLDPSDAKRKGNLMKWYRVPSWERHLISSIVMPGSDRIVLTVDTANDDDDDDDQRCGWLDRCIRGFTSMDLSILSDAPGVNVDRRIARLVFFAELLWNESLRCGAWDKLRKTKNESLLEGEQEIILVASAGASLTVDPKGYVPPVDCLITPADEEEEERVDTSLESRAFSSSAKLERSAAPGTPLSPCCHTPIAQLETMDKGTVALLNIQSWNGSTDGGDDCAESSASSILSSLCKSRQRDCSSTSAAALLNHHRSTTCSISSKATGMSSTIIMELQKDDDGGDDDDHARRATCMKLPVAGRFFTKKKKTDTPNKRV